ncbi:MAG: hypothetical protein WCH43_14390 [Verrucomicrobiota bacterium]|jgi:hypothetical protein
MATKPVEAEIAINAAAIKEAINKAVQIRCSDLSQEMKDHIVKVAIECISDEMEHVESRIDINKRVTVRLEQLVNDSAEKGVAL